MPDITLPPDYNPLQDPDYMSHDMIRYFEKKLNDLLDSILEKEKAMSLSLTEDQTHEIDLLDQGTLEALHFNDYSYQAHEGKIKREVEDALQRIQAHTYGYCQVTGEPIGVKRLLITPQARYCLEMQKELEEKPNPVL